MASVATEPEPLTRQVNRLRTIDNLTNWFYLARECLWPVLTVGLTLAFYECRADWGLSWVWNVPTTILAVIVIGACQHRLSNLGHEASHYMLFRQRLLNELVSDLVCMFPLWSTTHAFRLQHLAHHQYPNDPERDPDVLQMTASGHRFRFPMAPGRFLWQCVVKQLLWWPHLVRYVAVRARFANTGAGTTGPYAMQRRRAGLLAAAGVGYVVCLIVVLRQASQLEQPWLLACAPVVLFSMAVAFNLLAPERLYPMSIFKCDIAPRWRAGLRAGYFTVLFATLAWLTYLTGRRWFLIYLLLWVVPLLTSFALFMLLRQVVQHGNAGTERWTNTRVFRVGTLIRWAVFPLGMDYHLPHHLFPLVPHYRLRELHELLLENEEYRQQAVVVHSYFVGPPPTVLDLMAGPPV